MSKPVDPDGAPTAHSMAPRRRPVRLHENVKIASRMKPYANRLRLQVAHLDLTDPNNKQRLENARTKMTNLLVKKRVPKDVAQQAVAQALDIAADHQLQALRRDQDFKQLKRSLKRPCEAIRQRAGLGPIRLHDLRHSFGATGAASNLGLPVIGKLLGHRRAETTSRYAHIAADPLKIAADAIASNLAAKIGEPTAPRTSAEEVIRPDFKRSEKRRDR